MEKKLAVGTISLGVYYYDRFLDMIELNGGTVSGNVRSCVVRYVSDLWGKKYEPILQYTAAQYNLSPEEWQRRRKDGSLAKLEVEEDGRVRMSLPEETYQIIRREAEREGLTVEEYLSRKYTNAIPEPDQSE